MPGPMPYHLERGPWFYAIDEMLNDDDKLSEVIEHLATPGGLPQVMAKYVTWIEDDGLDPKTREHHLKRHWFGYSPKGAAPVSFTEWLRASGHPPASNSQGDVEYAVGELLQSGSPPAGWPTTGWWTGYHGDTEEIVRITLHQAAQISRGRELTTAANLKDPPRKLPVMAVWTCGQMWFEGWLVSRIFDDDRGIVTLHFNTPGMGDMPDMTPSSVEGATVDPPNPGSKDVANPVPPADQTGLGSDIVWVITHHSHVALPALKPDDGTTIAGIGDITIVQPAYRLGGPRPS